jgi:hypothetical protein
MEPQGLTKRIRAYLDQKPEGRLGDLYEAFDGESIRAINHVLMWLKKRKELKLPEPSYQYLPAMSTRRETKQTAIWRTIRYMAKKQRVLDLDEVQTIAEVSSVYLRNYAKWLEKQGYVSFRPTGLAVLDLAMKRAETPVWHCIEEKKNAG